MHLIRTGVAALLTTSFAHGAFAADLGGNCCADLEERVAELEATTARKGNRRVSLEVSGHVNEAVLVWNGFGDNGLDSSAIINNSDSESRFRFRGEAQLRPGWSAGFLMEFGASDLTYGGGPKTRHQALYIKSQQFGTFWLGHTSEASDGIMELAVAGAYTGATLGSLAPFDAFIRDQTGLVISNPFDGGRKPVFRYVSPEFAGFVASGSIAEDNGYDVALRYANEFNSIRLAAGIAYRKEDISTLNLAEEKREFWGGSASIMHTPTGLFIDGQYGVSNGVQTLGFDLPTPLSGTLTFGIPDTELRLWGLRGGISKRFTARGATTIWASYNALSIEGIDVDPTVWRLGIAQDIDAAAMTLYVNYSHIDLDLGVDDDSADVFLAGARISF